MHKLFLYHMFFCFIFCLCFADRITAIYLANSARRTWIPAQMESGKIPPKIASFSEDPCLARFYADLLSQYTSGELQVQTDENGRERYSICENSVSGYFFRHHGFVSFVPDELLGKEETEEILEKFEAAYRATNFTIPTLFAEDPGNEPSEDRVARYLVDTIKAPQTSVPDVFLSMSSEQVCAMLLAMQPKAPMTIKHWKAIETIGALLLKEDEQRRRHRYSPHFDPYRSGMETPCTSVAQCYWVIFEILQKLKPGSVEREKWKTLQQDLSILPVCTQDMTRCFSKEDIDGVLSPLERSMLNTIDTVSMSDIRSLLSSFSGFGNYFMIMQRLFPENYWHRLCKLVNLWASKNNGEFTIAEIEDSYNDTIFDMLTETMQQQFRAEKSRAQQFFSGSLPSIPSADEERAIRLEKIKRIQEKYNLSAELLKDPQAFFEAFRRQFKRSALKLHPDKSGKPDTSKQFLELTKDLEAVTEWRDQNVRACNGREDAA